MSKSRGTVDDILAAHDARQRLTHPHASLWSTHLWRVHRDQGPTTLGWVRYTHAVVRPWALYYDGTDEAGDMAWCRSFEHFGEAVQFAVQHAGRMRAEAKRLGPSRIGV